MIQPCKPALRTICARFSALLLPFLGPVLPFVSPQSASAATLVYAKASSTVTGGDSTEQSASFGTVSDVYIGNTDIGATAEGRAVSSFGVLRAYGTTSLASGGSFSSRFTTSTSAFQDDWLIDAPGLTGTAGKVRVRFTVDGDLYAVGIGTPTSSASAFLNNTWAQAEYGFGIGLDFNTTTKSQRVYGDGRVTGTPFLGIEQEFVLDFTYGTWLTDVTLRIGALSAVTAQFTNYTSETTADLENTAVWGGFADVRDSNGDLVTNYTFSSASGTNYVVAAPEPGRTLLLFAASSYALCAIRVRRRKTTRA